MHRKRKILDMKVDNMGHMFERVLLHPTSLGLFLYNHFLIYFSKLCRIMLVKWLHAFMEHIYYLIHCSEIIW